jgi:hypothetical protein
MPTTVPLQRRVMIELHSTLWKVESIIQAKYIVLYCATNMKPIDRPTNIVWPGPSTGCDAWRI